MIHAASARLRRITGSPVRRRFLAALLVVPLMGGVLAAPAAGPAHGDELTDVKAQQAAIERKIADQKKLISQLTSAQGRVQRQIASTSTELKGITSDLTRTRRKVTALASEIQVVQDAYAKLVAELEGLDAQLKDIEAEEVQKQAELRERKAQLASRIRDAYDAERTSMLETLLSGASFTDVLAEMSYQMDVAAQDRALAEKIAKDKETLAALHETVELTRTQTNALRQETAVQKRALDARMAELKKTQAHLKSLEAATKKVLAQQKAAYAKLSRDKAKLRKALASAAAARKRLQKKIDDLVARQYRLGNIPSRYNGTLRWPMAGSVTQPFGCTGFSWEPPKGSCAHFHNGIDMVAPYGTPVRASGAGRVVYIGWNYADGADPAWIVIIAHSQNLETWYAHMQPKYPGGIRAGSVVKAGQIIGYEGNTGHSTGAHLHWMVEYNGDFVNPMMFT